MHKRRIILIVFLILTAINILLFIFRKNFQYIPYASYATLYAPCDNYCVKKWSQLQKDYPVSELGEAKKISDSIIGDNRASAADKMLKLAGFIRSRLGNQIGAPGPALAGSSPLMQYKKTRDSDTVKLWCGNFAQIFAFFSTSQGISCRVVEIMNPGDHHVLNECFLPEQNEWVMVDVTNNLLMVSDARDHFLNLQSFRDSLKKNSPLTIFTVAQALVKKAPLDTNANYIRNYYRKEKPCFYYHRVDNAKVYTVSNKFKQYFWPVSWYDIYDNGNGKQSLYWLKLIFILLWLISFFVFIVSRTKFKA